MSFDVLRMARDPLNSNGPFFGHPVDTHVTRVVILDDHVNGPYWDLWQLFARPTEGAYGAARPRLSIYLLQGSLPVPYSQ